MLQWMLLSEWDLARQTISLGNMKAIFTQTMAGVYDVELEISSQKFLVQVGEGANGIERFEVVSVKWFVELSRTVVFTLKKLVEYLWYRL